MLKRILRSAHFYLIVTVNIIYAVDTLKGRIKKLAETDQVNSAAEYVAVRAARGHYFKPDGFETLKFDYEFYGIITNPKNGQPRR
jgi:hypothetical protein